MNDFVYQSKIDAVCVQCKYRAMDKCACGQTDCQEPISKTKTRCTNDYQRNNEYQRHNDYQRHNTASTEDCKWRKKREWNFYRWRGEQHGCYRSNLALSINKQDLPIYYADWNESKRCLFQSSL